MVVLQFNNEFKFLLICQLFGVYYSSLCSLTVHHLVSNCSSVFLSEGLIELLRMRRTLRGMVVPAKPRTGLANQVAKPRTGLANPVAKPQIGLTNQLAVHLTNRLAVPHRLYRSTHLTRMASHRTARERILTLGQGLYYARSERSDGSTVAGTLLVVQMSTDCFKFL